jgi:hypothetical protein
MAGAYTDRSLIRALAIRELPSRERHGWQGIATTLANLATVCAFVWALLRLTPSPAVPRIAAGRAAYRSPAFAKARPQAKKSVGIFVGINIFRHRIAH